MILRVHKFTDSIKNSKTTQGNINDLENYEETYDISNVYDSENIQVINGCFINGIFISEDIRPSEDGKHIIIGKQFIEDKDEAYLLVNHYAKPHLTFEKLEMRNPIEISFDITKKNSVISFDPKSNAKYERIEEVVCIFINGVFYPPERFDMDVINGKLTILQMEIDSNDVVELYLTTNTLQAGFGFESVVIPPKEETPSEEEAPVEEESHPTEGEDPADVPTNEEESTEEQPTEEVPVEDESTETPTE